MSSIDLHSEFKGNEQSNVNSDQVELKEEIAFIPTTKVNAVLFWEKFAEREQFILGELQLKKDESAMNTIVKIANEFDIQVEFRVGYGRWNGEHNEMYANNIELVLSANWNTKLIPNVELLFQTCNGLPSYWYVSKYCITNRKMLMSMQIAVKGDVIAGHEDIKGAITVSKLDPKKVDLLLLMSKPLQELLIKSSSNTYADGGSLLMQLLHNIMGEYNILHVLGEIIICKETPGPDLIVMKNSIKIKEEIDAIALFGVYPQCDSCHIKAYNHPLKRCSQCKKVRYCSKRCQRADSANHKLVCRKTIRST